MPTRSLLYLCGVLVAAGLASDARACACCASPGEFRDTVAKPSDYERTQIARLAFAAHATLFTGEADAGDIKGLKTSASDFNVAVDRAGQTWTMSFNEGGKAVGSLTFRVDQRLHQRAFDPRTTKPEPSEMIALDKDWTLTSPVTGTGMFDLAPAASIALVLHGRGNNCGAAEDFSRWTAVVNGQGFSFHFYGDLAEPTP